MSSGRHWRERLLSYSWLIAIVCLCFGLRIVDLDTRALSIDEATLASFVAGVIEKGYPYIFVSTMEVPLATYELVPYFLALSTVLGGEFNEFYLRLPALLFSTGTLVLIFFICKKQFGLLSAVIASTLMAVSTWSIFWSQNAFHPAQTQFFSLIYVSFIQRLLAEEKVKLSTAVAVWVSFSVTYLSWEGAGFLLPVSAVIALIIKRNELGWVFQKNIWLMVVLVLLTVVAQGVRRITLQEPHLMLGSGKGDVSLPQLGFLKDNWDPGFYFLNFFAMETHLLTGMIFLLGIYYFVKRRELRFFYLYFMMTVFCLSNFLLFYNAHYLFFIYSFFVISVGGILAYFIEDLLRWSKLTGSGLVVGLAWFSVVVLVTLSFATMNSQIVRFYDFGNGGHLGVRLDYRDGLVGPDYRRVAHTLRRQLRPSDKVISMAPMPTKLYSGVTPDYFLQTITNRKVVYDHNINSPFYRDKFLGSVVLRNADELKEILSRYDRVWLMASPWNAMPLVVDAETLEYVDENLVVVDESYDSRLYLWTK